MIPCNSRLVYLFINPVQINEAIADTEFNVQ